MKKIINEYEYNFNTAKEIIYSFWNNKFKKNFIVGFLLLDIVLLINFKAKVYLIGMILLLFY